MVKPGFNPFPVLTTEHLILRQLMLEDENEIFFFRSDDAMNKYVNKPRAKNVDDVRQFIEKINVFISNNESIYWVITKNDVPGLIGTICLWNFNPDAGKAELGYALHPYYQGKGLMNEALKKVLEYGFKILGLQAIEAWTHKDNTKSCKLLERNGFKRDFEAEKNFGNEKMGDDIIFLLSNTPN